MNMHNPPHPGEVLREWLDGVTVTDAAQRLGVTRAALSRVLNSTAAISPAMDLRLAKALGTTPGSWYAMQANYDMWQAQKTFRATKVRPITVQAA
jgi:addiction module HigA family antidote